MKDVHGLTQVASIQQQIQPIMINISAIQIPMISKEDVPMIIWHLVSVI